MIPSAPPLWRNLEPCGSRGRHCANAISALQALRGDPFDLIISDVVMPGTLTGFDIVQWIRKNSRTRNTPVAMLTGLRDPKDIRKALACGVDDYMVKPADPDILISKVKSLLDRNHNVATDFAQRVVHEPARLEVEALITNISEAGLTLSPPFPMRLAGKYRIAGKLLETVGLGPTFCRVLSCQRRGDNSGKYMVETVFVGLSESQLQLIRRWIICNPA